MLLFKDMEPQINDQQSVIAPLKKVTSLSKYLAMALFVILPFVGGWIGYRYAPEKVVEVVQEKIKTETKFVDSFINSYPDTVRELYFHSIAVNTDGTKQYIFDNPYEGYFPTLLLYKDSGIYNSTATAGFGIFATDPALLIEPYSNKPGEKSLFATSSDNSYLAVVQWLDQEVFCDCVDCVRNGVSVVELDTAKVVLDGSMLDKNISYRDPVFVDNRTVNVKRTIYEVDSVKSCLLFNSFKEDEVALNI